VIYAGRGTRFFIFSRKSEMHLIGQLGRTDEQIISSFLQSCKLPPVYYIYFYMIKI
jgi:hypothetical protein